MWFVMIVAGTGLLYASRHVNKMFDPIMDRAAGALFVGAGVLSTTGWVGDLLDAVVGWLVSAANSIGDAAVGTGLAWIAAAALGIMWFGAMMPQKLVAYRFPDWLLYSGVLLPGLLASVPGTMGNMLDGGITTIGTAANAALSGLL